MYVCFEMFSLTLMVYVEFGLYSSPVLIQRFGDRCLSTVPNLVGLLPLVLSPKCFIKQETPKIIGQGMISYCVSY
jgi:hypothetical protein